MNEHVPPRFQEWVLRHALASGLLVGYPLILAIQGPPGDGKSYQTALTLKQAGFQLFRLSGSLLGGSWEGESVKQVQDLYKRAAEYEDSGQESKSALLLDDFDLSPANQRDGIRYTVNSQLLTGFLMNLADDVSMCQVNTSRRIPIFLTGNDFSSLHGPLVRPGRMDFFTWVPNEGERAHILLSALDPFVSGLNHDRLRQLCQKNPQLPISAFVAAAQRLSASRLYTKISSAPGHHVAAGTRQLARQLDARGELRVTVDDVEKDIQQQSGGWRRPKKFDRSSHAR